jgi:hypothetical protein
MPKESPSVVSPSGGVFTACHALDGRGELMIVISHMQVSNGKAVSIGVIDTLTSNQCAVLNVNDNDPLIAVFRLPDGTKIEGADETIIAHPGEYWNL